MTAPNGPVIDASAGDRATDNGQLRADVRGTLSRLQACHDALDVETAIHEAGHSVALRLLRKRVLAIMLRPGVEAFAAAHVWPSEFIHGEVASAREELIFLAAGGAALRAFDPRCDPGDATDECAMIRLARTLHGQLASRSAIEREMATARRRADDLVREHWASIVVVAEALLVFAAVVIAIEPQEFAFQEGEQTD